MIYEYKALLNGVEQLGNMEAGSVSEVIDYLKSNNYFPVDVKEKKPSELKSFNNIFNRVTLKDITYLTRQMAVMLKAGLTLISAIEIISKQTRKDLLQELLKNLDKN